MITIDSKQIPTILIVDDVLENRKLLATLLKANLQCRIMMVKSGMDALKIFESRDMVRPTLILLDIMMPGMDGFETADRIKKFPDAWDIPILFITAIDNAEDKVRAFEAGGVDFISKPFNRNELLARVGVHLQLKGTADLLKEKNHLLNNQAAHLQALVSEKTEKLEKMNFCMVTALENANFYNDTDTGLHIRRVAHYSTLLAQLAGIEKEMVEKIRLYAPLHDVGKVGLPDNILKKPGKYTPDEFERMKQHVAIGGDMLGGEEFDTVAKNIALYHHEKWSGNGYLEGLSGEDIPIEARIVALVDVYDALTSARSYKESFSEEKTDRILKTESGAHFDPALVNIFFENKAQFTSIRNLYEDRS